jgi:hypothetical protein
MLLISMRLVNMTHFFSRNFIAVLPKQLCSKTGLTFHTCEEFRTLTTQWRVFKIVRGGWLHDCCELHVILRNDCITHEIRYIFQYGTKLDNLYAHIGIITSSSSFKVNEGVSKSFRTSRLERELQMVKLSATRCSCIAIAYVSLVSFAAVTLSVASQRVFIVISVYFVTIQSGNFWIHPRRPFTACSGSEFGMTPWTGDQPDERPLPTQRTTQHRKTRTHIHASSGIRTHDPSVRAVENCTCLRSLGSRIIEINNYW